MYNFICKGKDTSMKKFITSSLVVCTLAAVVISHGTTQPTLAASTTIATTTSTTTWNSAANLKRVNTIGQKLLSANNLPSSITFKVSDEEHVNAYANIDKEIYVYRGMLNNVENDDELAGVIAHELGHIVNGHCAKQTLVNTAIASIQPNSTSDNLNKSIQAAQQLSLLKVTRSDEFEADRTAVDLMMKAGYNPLALISVLNKICGNYIDVLQTHPSGEKRLLNIFDYANYNYPATVKANYRTDSYQKALQVIYANLKVRNASPRKLAKAKKEQEKLKKQQLKRAQRIANSSNPWERSYSALQILTAQ